MLQRTPLVAAVLALCISADAFSVAPSLAKLGGSATRLSATSRAQPALAPSARRAGRAQAAHVRMQLAQSAAATLSASQASTVGMLKQVRSMEPKGYPAEQGFASFSVAGGQGTMEAYEAPGKQNIAWCSSLNVAAPSLAVSSLTVWCGPLKEVPHLCTRTVVTDASVDLFIDFRPRAYAAYETRLPDGTYGEPTSREWFGFKSARDEFERQFFSEGVAAWANAYRSQGTPKAPPKGDDALYSGPLRIDVSLPAGDASVQLAANACKEAAAIWADWMDKTEPLPAGMKVTSTYAFDTKMRAQMFGVLANTYTNLFGDQGRALAAADAGPLDEAYVGGAS